VLESSGDTGIGSGCRSPDNKTIEFDIQFPASCPYITSVGGTESFGPEVAWSDGGGGFSKYFSRPWYQREEVDSYLRQVDNATIKYLAPYTDFGGRGVPDVSAHSYDPP
jgi:tripeptidyl-peptidase-1